MNKAILLFLIPTLALVSPAAAQKNIIQPGGTTIATSEIDKTVKRLMDAAEVTGLSLGIINNNKVVYIKSHGFKNKEKGELIDTATCFYGASLSKSVFAYLVLQLAGDGFIDLDKPLYTYLPKPLPAYEEYKDLSGDERWKLITARECLSHTTGFPNWRWANPTGSKKLEIFFVPGTRYAYSGEGLVLLQMVVETIMGTKLEDLAKKYIFGPFGMTRTSYTWQPAFESNYALGYDFNGEPLKKSRRTKANAAGSMETTIADYSRFIEAVMQGRAISPHYKKEMLTPQVSILTRHQFPSLNNDTLGYNNKIKLSYGLGWGIFNSSAGKAFFKEGHDDGWVHYTIHFPGSKISVIILCNSSNGESIFKELVEKITRVTIPWEWEGYTPYRPTIKLPETVLTQYTGVYEGTAFRAIVTLINGRLKVESEKAGLPAANLYAQNEHRFFLKVRDAELDFVKNKEGRIEKIILNSEGEQYELKKVNNTFIAH